MKKLNYYQIRPNKKKRKFLNLTFKKLVGFSGFETVSGENIILVFTNGSILGKRVYK